MSMIIKNTAPKSEKVTLPTHRWEELDAAAESQGKGITRDMVLNHLIEAGLAKLNKAKKPKAEKPQAASGAVPGSPMRAVSG